MRYILTLVLASVCISNVNAQSKIDQEIINDYQITYSNTHKAMGYAYDCSKSALYEEKMKEVFIYYEERSDYYIVSSGDIESEITLEHLRSYFKFKDDLVEAHNEASRYNMLCYQKGVNSAIHSEEELKEVISIYDYYRTLDFEYGMLLSKIKAYKDYMRQHSPDEVSCKLLDGVKHDCDLIDLDIAGYLSRVDTANSQFNNLPIKLQNLIVRCNNKEIAADSEDDTESVLFSKKIARLINPEFDDYLLFDKFKGFRMDLEPKEMNKKYISNYPRPSTFYLRGMADGLLSRKNCP